MTVRAREAVNSFKPYIPGKDEEEIKKQYGLDYVVKLASNENPYGPSEKALETVKSFDAVHLYPQSSYLQLQQEIANQTKFNREQIILGNGSDELIKLITKAFIAPGDEAITASITFPVYKMGVLEMDGKIQKVKLTSDYRHNVPGFLNTVNEQTKLIFICNPNNPTGTIITHQEAEQLMENVPSNVLVVFDEAYKEYCQDEDYPRSKELVETYPNLLVLRTFSKIYGLAGLRVGYGLGQEKLIKDLLKIKLPFNLNSIGLCAAKTALEDTAHIKYSRDNNQVQKDFLTEKISAMKSFEAVPTHGNFMLIKTKIPDKALFEELLKKGVIIRPGFQLGIENHFRVTIGTEEHNELLLSKLKECEVSLNDHCHE